MERKVLCKEAIEVIRKQTMLPYIDINWRPNYDGTVYTPTIAHDHLITRRLGDGLFYQFTNPEVIKDDAGMFEHGSETRIDRVTTVCEEYDNKVSLKFYFSYKSKRPLGKYFRKETSSYHFTFNTKTNDFFIVKRFFKFRRKGVSVKRNYFAQLFNIVEEVLRFLNGYKKDGFDTDTLLKPLYVFSNRIVSEGDGYTKNMLLGNNDKALLLQQSIIGTFIYKRGIKLPDMWKDLLKHHYPGMRCLRKNKMKLIPAILDSYGIKSKYTQRLLNTNTHMNLTTLRIFFHLLGKDNIIKLNNDVLFNNENNLYDYVWMIHDLAKKPLTQSGIDINDIDHVNTEIKICEKAVQDLLPMSEKRRIIKLLNLGVSIQEVIDHIVIRDRLQTKFGYIHKINYSDLDSFNRAHYALTKKEEEYKSSTYVRREFDTNFLNAVEDVIEVGNQSYHIKVLKSTYDYMEEGTTQKHCVSTYINRFNSVIVSIRLGDELGRERLTCEFVSRNYGGFESGQKKMKFNAVMEDHFEPIVEHVESLFEDNTIKDVVKDISIVDKNTDVVLKTIPFNGKGKFNLPARQDHPLLEDLPF